MTVKELIDKLETCPKDYQVIFESGDAYGSSYDAYVDDIIVNNKKEQVDLVEL